MINKWVIQRKDLSYFNENGKTILFNDMSAVKEYLAKQGYSEARIELEELNIKEIPARGGIRPNAGRKPAPIPLKAYSFKCTEEEYKQIKQSASAEGLTVSAYIRKQCVKGNNSD